MSSVVPCQRADLQVDVMLVRVPFVAVDGSGKRARDIRREELTLVYALSLRHRFGGDRGGGAAAGRRGMLQSGSTRADEFDTESGRHSAASASVACRVGRDPSTPLETLSNPAASSRSSTSH